jgi:hypothetical protein
MDDGIDGLLYCISGHDATVVFVTRDTIQKTNSILTVD